MSELISDLSTFSVCPASTVKSVQVSGTHFPPVSAGVQPSILCGLSRLAGTQFKLHSSLLNPSPDYGCPVKNSPPPLFHTASRAASLAKNTRLKPSAGRSSFYGQQRLVDRCWSLTLPPLVDRGPLSA